MEDNHNLIYTFLQKYKLSIDDWYGLAAIGLCKAAITFKEGVSAFSTYAYRCMFTSVYSEKRKEKQSRRIPEHQITYYQAEFDNSNGGDTSSFMNYIPSNEDVEDNVLSEIMFDEFSKKLKDRDKNIFKLFRDGYKQNDIGRIVGCSQAQVSRTKKKLIQYLEEY